MDKNEQIFSSRVWVRFPSAPLFSLLLSYLWAMPSVGARETFRSRARTCFSGEPGQLLTGRALFASVSRTRQGRNSVR